MREPGADLTAWKSPRCAPPTNAAQPSGSIHFAPLAMMAWMASHSGTLRSSSISSSSVTSSF